MISKRVLIVALSLLAVMPALVMAQATVNVDNFVVNQLSIDPASQLNLGSHGVATITPYADIRDYVVSGYAGTAWNGPGINSSLAASDANQYTSLATISGYDAINYVGMSSFYGHTIDDTDSLIRYTYYGDSNFDGLVNEDDFFWFDYGYGDTTLPRDWVFGDYNYDNAVNEDDFFWFDYVYANAGFLPPLGNVAAASAAAVPEPSSIILLALAGLIGLGVRKFYK